METDNVATVYYYISVLMIGTSVALALIGIDFAFWVAVVGIVMHLGYSLLASE